MMMNAVALCLVLSSLVTAGVWFPSSGRGDGRGGGGDVIVKEGHRVVVVEYDPETDGNTKVLISPHEIAHVSPQDESKGKAKETAEGAKGMAKETINEAKEKAKETGSVLPNLGLGVSIPGEPTGRGPRELVCDAYGKCKDKIASAMGKAKDKVSEKAHEVEEQAEESVSGAVGKTKDTLSNKTDEIASRAREVRDTVSDKVQRVGEGVKEAVDGSKTLGKDAAKNVASKLDEAREKAEKVKEEGERELGKIFGEARDLVVDVWNYVVSPRLVGLVMGVVHLLGFATAFGMGMWVTFVSSYVLAGALPRQQFGMVQSKVYPVYFRILAYTIMVTFIGHWYGQRKSLYSSTVGVTQTYSLLGSFGLVLFNLLYLEPRATKVMHLRMKMEKDESRGRGSFASDPTAKVADDHVSSATTPPAKGAGTMQSPSRAQEKSGPTDIATVSQIIKLGERLKKLNAYSSLLNIITLMALTGHLVYLGQRLHMSC